MGSKLPLLLGSGSLGIAVLIALAIVVFVFLKPKTKTPPSSSSSSDIAALLQQYGQSNDIPSGTCPPGAIKEKGVTCPGYINIPDDPTQTYETMDCLAWECYAQDTCSAELCTASQRVKYAKWYYIDQCGNYVFPTKDMLKAMGTPDQQRKCMKQNTIFSSIIGLISGIMDPEVGLAIQLGWTVTMTGLQVALQTAIKDGTGTSAPTAQSGKGMAFNGQQYGTGQWWTVQKLIDGKLGRSSEYVPNPPPNWELIANPEETFVYRVANDGSGNISDDCNSNDSRCPNSSVDPHVS